MISFDEIFSAILFEYTQLKKEEHKGSKRKYFKSNSLS
jgi:hypothetical protein